MENVEISEKLNKLLEMQETILKLSEQVSEQMKTISEQAQAIADRDETIAFITKNPASLQALSLLADLYLTLP